MHYVKHFDILGVNTAQIPCIELQGVPNSATEGAVGLLGMDMTSVDKDVYICTAVNGAIYTWKKVKDGRDGVCVRKAEINANGELIITLSDGTTLNSGVVKGEQGEKGKDGQSGKDGSNGKDGVGISKVEINTGGEMVITYTNGNQTNLGKVAGIDGASISMITTEEPNVQDGYTITPVTFVDTNGTSRVIYIKVQNHIIELNKGLPVKFFIGTHAEWSAYTGDKTDVTFLPTDYTSKKEVVNNSCSIDKAGLYACSVCLSSDTSMSYRYTCMLSITDLKKYHCATVNTSTSSTSSAFVGVMYDYDYKKITPMNMGINCKLLDVNLIMEY